MRSSVAVGCWRAIALAASALASSFIRDPCIEGLRSLARDAGSGVEASATSQMGYVVLLVGWSTIAERHQEKRVNLTSCSVELTVSTP
ncbi:hypothetical protein [Neorhodopirellula lusitana]|uniref:hypothetical protein n=1 Tax=Neorhodopirellula lusitana TaxID=445327 RepID=UPI00384BEAB0